MDPSLKPNSNPSPVEPIDSSPSPSFYTFTISRSVVHLFVRDPNHFRKAMPMMGMLKIGVEVSP